MSSYFLLLFSVFLPRFLLVFLVLGLCEDLVRDNNNIRIPTCSSGANRTWFFSYFSGGGIKTTSLVLHTLSIQRKTLCYYRGNTIEVFLRFQNVKRRRKLILRKIPIQGYLQNLQKIQAQGREGSNVPQCHYCDRIKHVKKERCRRISKRKIKEQKKGR